MIVESSSEIQAQRRPRRSFHLQSWLRSCWRRMTALAVLATAGTVVAACATAATYNPDHLRATRLNQVADVCQQVMGLSPAERPIWGTHEDANVAEGASHYQGCIASLSNSLQRFDTTRALAQADASCRARGLESNSPGLAVCVLQASGTQSDAVPAGNTPAVAAADNSVKLVAVGSFFYASPRETLHREQLACASIGISPTNSQFAQCVKSLHDTFFTIDNPVE